MRDTFLYTLNAIVPILLVVLLGYVVRRIGPWSDDFFKQLNKLCFNLFLPIHLFYSVYGISDLSSMNWRVVGFLFCGIMTAALIGFLAATLFVSQRKQKGVIIQCAFRSNQAILGLPLAQSLGGDPAMAFASVSTSLFVPLYNILAVVVLSTFGGDDAKRPTVKTLLRRVASNPLIIGTVIGLVVVIIRQFLPVVDGQPIFTIKNQLPALYQALTNLSRIASPTMLFVLGTRLDLSAVKELLPQLTLGVSLRLIMAPLVIVGGSLLLRDFIGLTALELPTLVGISATPVAVSSAVMTQEMGGDDQLASQLVIWTTVMSLFSVFCVVFLLRSAGFL